MTQLNSLRITRIMSLTTFIVFQISEEGQTFNKSNSILRLLNPLLTLFPRLISIKDVVTFDVICSITYKFRIPLIFHFCYEKCSINLEILLSKSVFPAILDKCWFSDQAINIKIMILLYSALLVQFHQK